MVSGAAEWLTSKKGAYLKRVAITAAAVNYY